MPCKKRLRSKFPTSELARKYKCNTEKNMNYTKMICHSSIFSKSTEKAIRTAAMESAAIKQKTESWCLCPKFPKIPKIITVLRTVRYILHFVCTLLKSDFLELCYFSISAGMNTVFKGLHLRKLNCANAFSKCVLHSSETDKRVEKNMNLNELNRLGLTEDK